MPDELWMEFIDYCTGDRLNIEHILNNNIIIFTIIVASHRKEISSPYNGANGIG